MERERAQYAFLGWILLCLLGWCTVQGVYAAQDDTASKSSMAREATLPEYVDVTTQHVIRLDGQDMAYTTTAGALTIPVEGGESQGKLFYVAYVMRDADAAQRPITFVFNGGPGAAAVYLHLGAIGPRRVALNDDGTVPPAPVRLVQNSLTWLAFTDVVFVDPIGTGYSRAARESDGKDKTNKFWGIEADLDSLGGFIRLYLSRNSRWLSPKFLAGESYGGFRVAALAQKLHAEFHIPLNGLVLLSPALEFSLHTVDRYRVLPWVLRIPAYAAVATFHGKSSLQHEPASELSTLLSSVEAFSLGDLLTGLAQGDRLGEEKAHVLYHRLSDYIGLSDELVRRYRGRIALSVFAKTLLRDSQRVISLYDGSVATIDANPAHPVYEGQDPRLHQLSTAFSAAFNSYIREELQFTTDLPYLALNPAVHEAWNWRSGVKASQGFVGTAEALKTALTQHQGLKALIVHGYYDLVTPYFTSEYVVRQMALDPAIQPHLTVKVYEGGHMFYTHMESLKRFYQHVRAFFRRLVAPSYP